MRLNSYNLVMSAMFGGRRGPRPPAGNPTSIACHGLMDKVGVSFPEAHLNPNAMAELALAGHEVLGFDTVMPSIRSTRSPPPWAPKWTGATATACRT